MLAGFDVWPTEIEARAIGAPGTGVNAAGQASPAISSITKVRAPPIGTGMGSAPQRQPRRASGIGAYRPCAAKPNPQPIALKTRSAKPLRKAELRVILIALATFLR